eukprot:scaffold859_cov306-Pinguiococcus_pyrenoidosus.AAC.14
MQHAVAQREARCQAGLDGARQLFHGLMQPPGAVQAPLNVLGEEEMPEEQLVLRQHPAGQDDVDRPRDVDVEGERLEPRQRGGGGGFRLQVSPRLGVLGHVVHGVQVRDEIPVGELETDLVSVGLVLLGRRAAAQRDLEKALHFRATDAPHIPRQLAFRNVHEGGETVARLEEEVPLEDPQALPKVVLDQKSSEEQVASVLVCLLDDRPVRRFSHLEGQGPCAWEGSEDAIPTRADAAEVPARGENLLRVGDQERWRLHFLHEVAALPVLRIELGLQIGHLLLVVLGDHELPIRIVQVAVEDPRRQQLEVRRARCIHQHSEELPLLHDPARLHGRMNHIQELTAHGAHLGDLFAKTPKDLQRPQRRLQQVPQPLKRQSALAEELVLQLGHYDKELVQELPAGGSKRLRASAVLVTFARGAKLPRDHVALRRGQEPLHKDAERWNDSLKVAHGPILAIRRHEGFPFGGMRLGNLLSASCLVASNDAKDRGAPLGFVGGETDEENDIEENGRLCRHGGVYGAPQDSTLKQSSAKFSRWISCMSTSTSSWSLEDTAVASRVASSADWLSPKNSPVLERSSIVSPLLTTLVWVAFAPAGGATTAPVEPLCTSSRASSVQVSAGPMVERRSSSLWSAAAKYRFRLRLLTPTASPNLTSASGAAASVFSFWNERRGEWDAVGLPSSNAGALCCPTMVKNASLPCSPCTL